MEGINRDDEEKRVIADIIEVPDVHLYDKNIGSTLDYDGESLFILDSVLEVCDKVMEETGNTNTHVVFGGDLFHARLTDMEFFAGVCNKLTKLKEKVKGVYSLKGNHDISAKFKYSFYDLIIDLGVVSKTDKLVFGNGEVVVNIFDYALDTDQLQCERCEGNKTNIGVYHNNIIEVGLAEEEPIGIRIDPEKDGIFDNIDIAIINHIHTRMGDRSSLINGRSVRMITPGSVGRPGNFKYHEREDAVLPRITIYEDYSVKVSFITIFLTPVEEFFDLRKSLEIKRIKNNFKVFSDSIESLNITFEDAAMVIAKMKDIDEKIKTKTINYIKQVD